MKTTNKWETETTKLLRESLVGYRGAPFLCGEYARKLGVSWHKMNVAISRLIETGELEELRIPLSNSKFYHKRIY